MSLEDLFQDEVKTARKSLSLVSFDKDKDKVTASIEARNESEATSYFKGRFGIIGKVKSRTINHYIIVNVGKML